MIIVNDKFILRGCPQKPRQPLFKKRFQMTPEKRNLINGLALNFRNAMGIDEEKFDIEKTVNMIGGKIEYIDDGFNKEEAVVKTESGGFFIRIDKNSPKPRQRFSVARELGRLFMHMHYGYDEWERVEPGERGPAPAVSYTDSEEEANEFAAAFLMPSLRFIEIAEENSDGKFFCPEKIAERFDVYKGAVIYRGKNLGLWK